MKETHIYICGAKGISQYGGFESFVLNLLEHSIVFEGVKFHIACKANGQGAMDVHMLKGTSEIQNGRFAYCNADCFLVPVPSFIGSAQAIIYDIVAIREICKDIEKNHIKDPVVYILTCRIGPCVKQYVDRIHRCGGKVYLNPDGHEWARRKWSRPVRAYWKISEKMMVRNADHIICDNRHIEKYIQEKYRSNSPITSFIPYGCDVTPSKLANDDYRFINWTEIVGVTPDQYYLVVGRFVEENNFDIIMREFMKSNTKRKLVLLTTNNKKLKKRLNKELNYSRDGRVVLTNPVYDVELLKKIRENAYAYIHGHEVGGTNPSLLEGLASTNINLVLGVEFNKEVAGETALYWQKTEGELKQLIDETDLMSTDRIISLGESAKERVSAKYDWDDIAQKYINQFSRSSNFDVK